MKKIGDFIRIKRIKSGLTQKELAEGITTQSHISKIEKNEIMPLANLLIEMANKLEVSLDELLNFHAEQPKISNKLNSDIFESLLLQYKYKEIENLILNIDNKHLEFHDYIFIKWLDLLISYRLYNNDIREKCLHLLKEIPHNKYNHLKIKILNTLAIYNRNYNFYEESLSNFEDIFILFDSDINDIHLYLKINLNYLNLLRDIQKYQKIYEISIELIGMSFSNKNYNFIPEFVYNKYYSLSIINSDFTYDVEELYFAKFLAKKLKKYEVVKLLNEMK